LQKRKIERKRDHTPTNGKGKKRESEPDLKKRGKEKQGGGKKEVRSMLNVGTRTLDPRKKFRIGKEGPYAGKGLFS